MEKISDISMRIIALVLVFFLGFISCIGSMVGGAYILYSKLSIHRLQKWGLIDLNTDKYIDESAAAPLTSMTLELLLKEYNSLRYVASGVTVDYMIDRYGIKLPEAIDEILPEEVRELKVNEVLGPKGKDAILDGITVKTLLRFVPDGTVSEPAREALKNKTLREVVDGDLGHLLTGVHLGYLVGVEYELSPEGTYIPVILDPEHPTLFELIAPVDIGEMLTVFGEGGDVMGLLRNSVGNVMLLTFVETLMGAPSDMIGNLMADKKLEDVIVMDEETGLYSFKIDVLLEGKMIGDLMGYTAIWSETEPPYILEWQNEGERVTGYMRGLASADAGAITSEEFKPEDLFADVYLGDFMNYTPVLDETGAVVEWTDAEGEPIGKAYRTLAMKSVAEMTSEGMEFDTLFTGIYVGDFYGYVYDEERGVWTKEVSEGVFEDVVGMDRAIAGIEIGRLLSDGDYDITSEFEGMKLGELLGYEKVGDDWYKRSDDGMGGEQLERVSVMESAIADADASDLMSGELDVADCYKDVFVGDMMDYIRGEEILPEGGVSPADPQDREYEWYEVYDEQNPENNVLASGIEGKFANYSLYKLINGEQTFNADEVTEGMSIAEVMGLTEKQGYLYNDLGEPITVGGERILVSVWYDENDERVSGVVGAMANKEIDDLTDSQNGFDSIFIGDVLGQIRVGEGEDAVWYEIDEVTTYVEGGVEELRVVVDEAEGMMTNLSDLTVGDLSDNKKVTDRIQTVKVGDAMGWTRIERVLNGETVVTWYTEYNFSTGVGTEASGTLAALADYSIGELDTEIELMPVGKLLGWKKIGNKWYDDGVAAEGIMKSVADIPLGELSTQINDIKIGKIMDWEEHGGVWYEKYVEENHPQNVEASGIMAAFANLTIDEMSDPDEVSTVVRTVKVGDAMGWSFHGGEWYEKFVEEGSPENKLASGPLGALADSQIGSINSEINTLTVGELLDWNEEGGVWTDENGQPITGLMKVVAGYRVNELSTEINNITIGKVMDWEKHDDVWYVEYVDENHPDNILATGIMLSFADLTVSQMSDADTVEGVVQDLKLGDAMGWTKIEDKWYSSTDPLILAAGTMAALADFKVNELEDEVMKLNVGDAMGWHMEIDPDTGNHEWYRNYDPETGVYSGRVTGFMGVIADHPITEIENEIHTEKAGVMLDYELRTRSDGSIYDGQDWWHEVIDNGDGTYSYEPVSKMTNYMCNRNIEDLGSSFSEITIKDVYDFTPAQTDALDFFVPGWQNLSITGFCDAVANAMVVAKPGVVGN